MLEMLKERKAALEAQGKKGFTLMEMLIVIAIIAILIAIAIPLFTQQLNAAKQAADESNARALYAQLQADYMLGSVTEPDGVPITTKGGTVKYGGTTYEFSDVCTSLTYTAPTEAAGTTPAAGPKISLTTNGKTVIFPDKPTGQS